MAIRHGVQNTKKDVAIKRGLHIGKKDVAIKRDIRIPTSDFERGPYSHDVGVAGKTGDYGK